MSSDKDAKTIWWEREQIRGLFVLGFIAILLGMGHFYEGVTVDFGIIEGIPITNFIFPLLYFWGIYALLMVFAVSDDFFKKSTTSELYKASRLLLIIGAYTTIMTFLVFFILGNIFRLQYLVIPIIPMITLLVITAIKSWKEKKALKNTKDEKDKIISKKNLITQAYYIIGSFSMYLYINIIMYLFNMENTMTEFYTIDFLIVLALVTNLIFVFLHIIQESRKEGEKLGE